FTYEETSNEVILTAIALQGDGKILVGGFNHDLPGAFCKRLNPDGSIDPSFTTQFNAGIANLLLQENGKVIATGNFTNVNNTVVGHIVRLNSDGSIDNTFLASGTSGTISQVIIQPDGKLLICGSFSEFNGSPKTNIVRLNGD